MSEVDSGKPGEPRPSEPAPGEVDFVALQPGQTIGRYEIVSVLGQGGFGITYRARDAQLNREVAIKEYLPSALAVRQGGSTVLPRSTKVADDFGWGRQRFVDEGRTLATLSRAPAIVRVFDFLEANGTAYIVMELVPGSTLEDRLTGGKTLSPAEIDKILWPLLEGLQQVHDAGFLHRDIKPSNILLDEAGNPTLIDFGASRSAMTGRTVAMTAIFTPGYAASEQITSARQGPWTDIYAISATLYHAIIGAPPPSAFDRMLDDAYQPLTRKAPAGFTTGLLVGIDAGLSVRPADRPQDIAGWRQILRQSGPLDAQATVALRLQPVDPNATVMVRSPSRESAGLAPGPPPVKRRAGLWVGLAAAMAAVAVAGGGYYVATRPAPQPAVQPVDKAAAKVAPDQEARDQAARDKAEQARSGADTKRKADEEARRAAEAGEVALHLSVPERQHIQVALSAVGFVTNGTDGVFGGHTRDMIAGWQKARNYVDTGFLTGPEGQALVAEPLAVAAIAKFDEDNRKTDEEKAKAAQPQQQAAVAPKLAPVVPTNAPDGLWRGTFHCSATGASGPFTIGVQIRIVNGAGTWTRPGSGPGTTGNQTLTIRVSGTRVDVARSFVPPNRAAEGVHISTMTARYEGSMITGSGPEANSGGRNCELNLTR